MRFLTRRRRERIHLCTMTPDQRPYAEAVTRWLRRQGYRDMVRETTPVAERIAAARSCDICLLLLGPTYASRDPQSSFSIIELEAYAALEGDANKLLIFAHPAADTATSLEQREFVARLRSFTGGTFQATCATPAEFVTQVRATLKRYRMAKAEAAALDIKRAIMISSTGDLAEERAHLRTLLTRQRHPVIDYLTASSETTTPIEQVTGWARQCRALILVLGQRYGYVSPMDGLGVTELEFVTALNAGRPILALLRPDALSTSDPDQQQFVARVRHLLPAKNIRLCPTLSDAEREARAGLRHILAVKSAPIPAIPADDARQWYRRQLRRWLGHLPHPRNPAGMPLTTMPLLLAAEHLDADAVLSRTENRLTFVRPESLAMVRSFTPEDILASTPRLALIGSAGAGKSVILRWYALNATSDQTPVLITLPAYMRAKAQGWVVSLLDYVEYEERRMFLAAPGGASHWRSALLAGQGLLLLDDWAMLTEAEQALVAPEIEACATELPSTTPIVIAQRALPARPQHGFTAKYILPLMQGQQQEIVTQWITTAHADEHLSEDQLRQRVARVMYPMRTQSGLTSWARTPLMLNTLTTILDGAEGHFSGILAGSGEALVRQALRLLFTFETHPHYLWEKEHLLLALARLTLHDPPQRSFMADQLESAWGSIAAETSAPLERVMDDLRRQSLVLYPDQEQGAWAYNHPVFQMFYEASVLTSLPSTARGDYIARHRLFVGLELVFLYLPAMLDRLGHPKEAGAVIATLIRGDDDAIAGSGYPDPLHTALTYAAIAQGGRAREYATREYGPEIARRLGKWLREHSGVFPTIDTISQSLVHLGPAAAAAIDDLVALPDTPHAIPILVLRELARDGNARAREAVAAYEARHPRDTIADSVYRLDARLEEARAGLRSNEQETRRTAVLAIAKFGPHAAPAVSELTAALADPDDFVREKACLALLAIGAASAPALPELLRVALHDADNWVRGAANEAIACLSHSAAYLLPSVEAQLHAEDPSLRAHAIMTLGAFGEHASFLAPALISMVFHDPGNDVAIRAVIALKQMGAEAIAALNTAAEAALRSGDQVVKETVLPNLLFTLGPRAAPLVEAVRTCIDDPDLPQHVRGRIIASIGYLKSAAEPLISDLRLLLGDRTTSWTALQALGEMGAVGLPLLDDVLALHDDSYDSIRAGVYSALRAMRAPNTPEVMAAWMRGMDDSVKMVRSSACDLARVLRPMTPAIVGELVRRYYTETDSDDRRDLIFVLNECLPTCWDVGPLSPDAESAVLQRDRPDAIDTGDTISP